jgi:hypothetical protein
MASYEVMLVPVSYKRYGETAIGYEAYIDGKLVFDGSSLKHAVLAVAERLLTLERKVEGKAVA